MMPAWSAILWFVVVVAAIPAALWLLRRTPYGAAAAGAGGLRTVTSMALSNTQRIVTVEVGRGESRCWLVLGVTPGGITALHAMPPQDDPAAPPAPPAAFAQLLRRIGGDGAPDGH